MADIKAGDNILWKGDSFHWGKWHGITVPQGDPLFETLSRADKYLIDPWWDRQAWHVGYVVTVLNTGEIVTSQSEAEGVETITYNNLEAMGHVRIYHWLKNPDQEKILGYAAAHKGRPYDGLDYVWTVPGALAGKYLNYPFRIVDKAMMCWENMSQFDRYMGQELQPEEWPCLISRMQKVLAEQGELVYSNY